MNAPLTPREMVEFQIHNQLEAFYLLSVDEAVIALAAFLQPEVKDGADESAKSMPPA